MAKPNLPPFTYAFRSLSATGRAFPESHRNPVTLKGLSYPSEHGAKPVELDTLALSGVQRVYAAPGLLSRRLSEHGPKVAPTSLVVPLLTEAYQRNMVVGFSGFTMPDKPYDVEARGMLTLFTILQSTFPATLVTDGGGSDGVLGLSGVLASFFNIPSLGYVPVEGLASMGPRTHLVVHKTTFQEREALVGLTPDLLVCVGGGPRSLRECVAALDHDGVVLLLSLRDYDYPEAVPLTYSRNETMREALKRHRLIICRDILGLRTLVPQAIATTRRFSIPARPRRLAKLVQQLQ